MTECNKKEINIEEKFEELKVLIIDKDKDNASIESLKAVHKRIGEMDKSFNERFGKIENDIKPVIELFQHMNWGRTAVLYMAGFVISIGSAIFTIKSCLDYFKK